MDSFCSFCGFFDHTEDTCRTLQDRRLLADGLPAYAPSCEHHSKVFRELNNANRDSTSDWSIIPQTPATPVIFDQNVTSETALFPICATCTRSELGATDFEVSQYIDVCFCASKIVESACWYCTLEEIQSRKLSEFQRRVHETELGSGQVRLELLCHCGDFVPKPEKARKCVGCGGLVSTPFRNFAGDEMVFSFAMPNLLDDNILSGSSRRLHIANTEKQVDFHGQIGQDIFQQSKVGANSPEHPCFTLQRNDTLQKSTGRASVTDVSYSAFPAETDSKVIQGFGDGFSGHRHSDTDTSEGMIDSVLLESPVRVATTSGVTDIFTPYQAEALKDVGLGVPEKGVPLGTELPPSKKIDLLLLANHLKKIQIRDLPRLLEVCCFPSPVIDVAVNKIREDLRTHGEWPKCLGVLYVLRQRGWAQR